MRNFHKLEDYSPDKGAARRHLAANVLDKNSIKYTCPSKGHYKIFSKKCHTLMLYPKSGMLIWKTHRKGFQHRFINDDEGKLVAKIQELI